MKLLVTALLFLISLTICGQKIRITGKVADQNNIPIPYATLKLKGTSLGTCTNADGTYTINTTQKFDSIICTHINYESSTEAFESNTIINFSLARKIPIESSIIATDSSAHKELPIADSVSSTFYELKPFIKVEINASFPGGQKALLSFLDKNISLVDSMQKLNPKGTVKVSFIISTSGLPTNIKIIKGVNSYLDNKVINAVQNMPKWTPAMQNGRYVEQERHVSVSFKNIDN